MKAIIAIMLVAACGPRQVPTATPGQTVREAVVLVCDAPARAEHDSGSRADAIAGHLTDGIDNRDVLLTVEGWKTDGVNMQELEKLVRRANLKKCRLRDEAR